MSINESKRLERGVSKRNTKKRWDQNGGKSSQKEEAEKGGGQWKIRISLFFFRQKLKKRKSSFLTVAQ